MQVPLTIVHRGFPAITLLPLYCVLIMHRMFTCKDSTQRDTSQGATDVVHCGALPNRSAATRYDFENTPRPSLHIYVGIDTANVHKINVEGTAALLRLHTNHPCVSSLSFFDNIFALTSALPWMRWSLKPTTV